MRTLLVLSSLLLSAGAAGAQTSSVSAQAAGGLTLIDAGHNLSAGVAWSPLSRVRFMLGVERTHLDSRVSTHIDGPSGQPITSLFRGGTLTAVSGTIRVSLFPDGRVTPYVLAGIGNGVSKPNVNEHFPTPVTNRAVFGIAGAGLAMPVGDHLSVFGDARMMVGAEGREGMIAVAPVRIGVNWRF